MNNRIFILLTCIFINLQSNIGSYGFNNFANYYFVETGLFKGNGIQKALDANCFKELYSIEANPKYVNAAKQRFSKNKNVKILNGSSGLMLWDVIKNLKAPITFWLDAHIYPPIYNGKDGRKNSPIMEELEQISRHPIKTHTILIDDMNCCGRLAFDYVTKKDLIKKIKEINPNYIITFLAGGNTDEVKNNVLVARIK